jgi:hypothetical protein
MKKIAILVCFLLLFLSMPLSNLALAQEMTGLTVEASVDTVTHIVTIQGKIVRMDSSKQIVVLVTNPNGGVDYIDQQDIASTGAYKFAYPLKDKFTGMYTVTVGTPDEANTTSTTFRYSTNLDSETPPSRNDPSPDPIDAVPPATSREDNSFIQRPEEGSSESSVLENIHVSDIHGHWAEASLRLGLDLGIINGYHDHTLRPDNPITRGEFTVMICRAMKLQEEDSTVVFTDTIPHWVKRCIAQTVKSGIIKGYEDNTFRSGKIITMVEMTTIIKRALGMNAEAFMAKNSSDRFDPNRVPTRAEALVQILLMLDSDLEDKKSR